jgi:hypothetical protein
MVIKLLTELKNYIMEIWNPYKVLFKKVGYSCFASEMMQDPYEFEFTGARAQWWQASFEIL